MIEIRPATPEDAATIAGINVRGWQTAYRGVFPDEFLDAMQPDRRESIVEELLTTGPPNYGSVAVSGHQVVGFVMLGPPLDSSLDPNEVQELYSIYIEPDRIGTGVGRLLMDDALRHLRDGSWSSAILWVLREARRARRFYEAAGWHRDGEERTEEIPAGNPVVLLRYRIGL